MHAERVGVDPRFVGRQVGAKVGGSWPNRGRVEDHDVRVPAFAQDAAFAQTEEFGGDLSELMYALLQADYPMFAHPISQNLGGKRKGIDHIQVRAGVGGANDGAFVGP